MKIAIIGFGSEGLSAYNYFLPRGADITIFDESESPNQQVPAGAKFVYGKGCFDDLQGFDKVVRFPAIPPNRIHTDGEVTSVIKEFFSACPAPIIGVTGSKGKGTTSSFIYSILQKAGIKTHLAGNIGVPALNILPDVKKEDVVVLELSSFQLWDLQQSPQVAVVLMIEPEHLNIHTDLDDYLDAKTNITRWQSADDRTVYLPGNKLTERVALVGKGKKIPYTQAPGAHVEDGWIIMDGVKICKTTDIQLPGAHNVQNACAAMTAAWQFTQDAAAIAEGLRAFGGLDHRIKFVKEVSGVRYFDDSIATTPGSVIAVVNAFTQPMVLILGGDDKGADYAEMAETIENNDVRGVVIVGGNRQKIQTALTLANYKRAMQLFDTSAQMPQIVAAAAKMAQTGDVVVLSPAAASFDMFKNYQERGDKFIAAVKVL